jgi:hypothetical protein
MGLDASRFDQYDVNAKRCQLDAESIAQGFQGKLRTTSDILCSLFLYCDLSRGHGLTWTLDHTRQ